MSRITFDLVTEDLQNREFVVYLVENGPWQGAQDRRIQQLQGRLYDAFDAIVDGYLAARFPESTGKNIRIQVDCHDAAPPAVLELVRKFDEHIKVDAEYQKAVAESPYVHLLRAVNGKYIGRKLR